MKLRFNPFSRPARVVAALALSASPVVHAASATWGSATTGNWSLGSNWSPTAAPGSTSGLTNADVATFNNAAGGTITIDSASQNIGSLLFSGTPGAYIIGSLGANAGNSLFLSSGRSINSTATNSVTQTINAPLVLAPASATTAGTYVIENNNNGGGAMAIAGNISGGTTTLGITLTIRGFNSSAGNLFSGIISNGGASGGVAVTKTGSGTWVLSGNNTYTGTTTVTGGTLSLTGANTGTGATTVTGGTLNLGNGTATGSLASTVLNLGGGTLSYTRTGSQTQGFTTTNLDGGGAASAVSVVSGNILNLGTIVNNGGTINFGSTGAGIVGALVGSNTNGIISGATFTSNTWAVATGAGSAITGLGSYINDTWASTNNTTVTTSSSPTSGSTTNSLRFDSAAANTLTLAGVNTINSSGILVTSAVGNNLSTITGGNLTGASGKSLVVIQNNTSNGLTISSNIAANGTAGLSKFGVGLLTLSGNNTYTGNTTVGGGTLKAGSTTALSSGSAFSVAAGATLDLGGFNNTISSLATATGTITDSSALGSGGTLRISTALPAGTAQLFTGSLGLQVFGGGTVNVFTNTANAYSGGTTLGNGTGSTFTRVILNGVTVGAGGPGTITSGIFGKGAITIGASATDLSQIMLQAGTPVTINNAIVVNSALGLGVTEQGAFRVDSTGNVLAGTINANLAAVAFSNISGAGSVSLTNTISGTSGLTLFASSGTSLNVTLNNAGTANSYAGDTTITSVKETLTLGAANQIPNGALKGNLIVTLGAFNMGGFSETINGLSGTGTVDGISGTPTLTVGDDNATGASNTFSGVIKNTAGSLALTKTGSGTLTLSGNNTYAGATTIGVGTLKAGSVTGLSSNSAFSVAASATLDLGGFNNTIKTLSTSGGTITNSTGNATLRIADAKSAGVINHLFTGSLALQIFGGGSGDTILGNTANTYSGGTILGNGTGSTFTRVLLTTAGTIGAGAPGAVTSGIFGTGAISIGAAATDQSQIYFGAAITLNNDIVVNSALGTDVAGSFRPASTGVVLAGAINANLADVTFNTGNTAGVQLTGAISGASGLKIGAGNDGALTVTLANTGIANSYAGNTTISTASQILALGAANQIPNGAGKGNLVVTAGKFNMGGFSETINGLSGAGTVDGTSGTPTLTVGDNNATGAANTFSGVIKNTAGTLALTKTGSGTLTLSGANTYTGQTTISTGTLQIGAGSTTGRLTATTSISNNSNLTISRSDAFSQATDLGAGVAITGTGSFTQAGAGTTTLTAANTYSGLTTVSVGTLLVNNTSGSGTGTGAVSVSGGASLGGTGTIKPTLANGISIASTGKLAPGASNAIGALTIDLSTTTGGLAMASGSIFDWQLSGSGGASDQVNFWNYNAGDLALNSNAVNLKLTGAEAAGNYTTTLFKFYSDAGTTLMASGISSGLSIGTLTGSFSGTPMFDYSTTGEVRLNYSVVPEPTSALAGLLIGAGLLRRRRGKNVEG